MPENFFLDLPGLLMSIKQQEDARRSEAEDRLLRRKQLSIDEQLRNRAYDIQEQDVMGSLEESRLNRLLSKIQANKRLDFEREKFRTGAEYEGKRIGMDQTRLNEESDAQKIGLWKSTGMTTDPTLLNLNDPTKVEFLMPIYQQSKADKEISSKLIGGDISIGEAVASGMSPEAVGKSLETIKKIAYNRLAKGALSDVQKQEIAKKRGEFDNLNVLLQAKLTQLKSIPFDDEASRNKLSIEVGTITKQMEDLISPPEATPSPSDKELDPDGLLTKDELEAAKNKDAKHSGEEVSFLGRIIDKISSKKKTNSDPVTYMQRRKAINKVKREMLAIRSKYRKDPVKRAEEAVRLKGELDDLISALESDIENMTNPNTKRIATNYLKSLR